MYRQTVFAALLLTGAIAAVPASAQSSSDRTPGASGKASSDRAPAAHRRRITIYPRHSNEPGPNSKRICQAHLEKEYRVSGTVIVPVMHCWWD